MIIRFTVLSILYHSMGMELWPCGTAHQEIPLTGTGRLLNGLIWCCVSCIFSVNPQLVACIALHTLTFASFICQNCTKMIVYDDFYFEVFKMVCCGIMYIDFEKVNLKNVCIIIMCVYLLNLLF